MAFQEQVNKLIARLTDLTKEGKVQWTETGDRETFLAPITTYRVTITKIGNLTVQFRVFDPTGKLIEETTGAMPDMSELFNLARRQARGTDKVLSELLVSLEQIH